MRRLGNIRKFDPDYDVTITLAHGLDFPRERPERG